MSKEQSDEKILKEGEKTLKEKLKAKQRKGKNIQKIIINAKVALATIVFLMKIFTVILSVCLVVSLMQLSISSNDDDEDEEEYESVVEEFDLTSEEELLATEDEISSYITNYSTEHEDLRTVMLGKTSDIIQWQTDYGYSAKLFVTVAFEEYPEKEENVPGGNAPEGDTPEAEDTTSKAETYFLEFLTNMNDQASTWKDADGNKLTTIEEIAKMYVGDESYIEWANNIQNKM